MSLTLILVALLVVLLGCQGYDRLVNGREAPVPQAQAVVTVDNTTVVKGFLSSQNFVEIPKGTVDYVEFKTEHSTSYKEIPPYSKKLEEAKKPFYIVSPPSVILFNVTRGSYRIYVNHETI